MNVRSLKLKRNYNLLKLLHDAEPEQQRRMLQYMDKELIDTLCECSLNILKGNVTLSDYRKKQLRKYKNLLRNLINRKISWQNKKKKIIQSGGFNPIIGAVLGVAVKEGWNLAKKLHAKAKKSPHNLLKNSFPKFLQKY